MASRTSRPTSSKATARRLAEEDPAPGRARRAATRPGPSRTPRRQSCAAPPAASRRAPRSRTARARPGRGSPDRARGRSRTAPGPAPRTVPPGWWRPGCGPRSEGPCPPPARRHATWAGSGGNGAAAAVRSRRRDRGAGAAAVAAAPCGVGPGGGARSRRGDDLAAGHGDGPAGQGRSPLVLVRRQEHGRAPGDGVGTSVVEKVAVGGVQPGVGLVEQPELGLAGDQHGQRGAPALPGRQPAHRRWIAAARSGRAGPGRPPPPSRRPPAARVAKRTLSSTVRSSYRAVA